MRSRGQIILVDDEPDLASAFAEYLCDRGFDALTAACGADFDRLSKGGMPDLVVLDLMMPHEDGSAILSRIRAKSDVPVIIMSSADGMIDRVLCLEMGADDMVSKPADPRELAARIEGLIARRRGRAGSLVRLESVTIDLRAARILRDNGGEEQLGPAEMMLLRAFLDHPHELMTREQLIEAAPAGDRDAFRRSIDPRIARLKRKLATGWIELRRGQGYIYAPPREQAARARAGGAGIEQ